ncbi:potassium voltage-gated channel protein Shal-like [Condylostylus longicornis]|uniref:potassium voltage-gated channel protein Shal-like n=1 Tax=Condylostylus longicornis TaxID=2530218 RepID=UPI00244DAECB|nr:potassium voltage-gated channel protein Shal-like [Condylostylus longicornis]
MEDENILINVSGHRFETKRSTLDKHPNTLLGSNSRETFYNKITKEYYFDRDPNIFRYILNYYRTDRLHFPKNECVNNYDEELEFFGMTSKILIENDEISEDTQKWKSFVKKIHESKFGLIFHLITGLFIIIFVIANFVRNEQCPNIAYHYATTCSYRYSNGFFYLDLICVISFTIEFIVRFVFTASFRFRYTKINYNIKSISSA